MTRLSCVFCPGALAVLLLTGCGSDGTHLTGTVSLDGQPVDGGTIAFVATDGQGVNASGRIEGGEYDIPAPAKFAPGTYKVEIDWLKPTGKAVANKSDPGTTREETKQVIPLEYNRQSKLTAEVKSGSNTFDFDLKSGGPVDGTPAGGRLRAKAAGDS